DDRRRDHIGLADGHLVAGRSGGAAAGDPAAAPAAHASPRAGDRLPGRRGRRHHRQRRDVPLRPHHPLRTGAVGEDRRGTGGPTLRPGQAHGEHRQRRLDRRAARTAQSGGGAAACPADRPRHRDHGGAVSARGRGGAAAGPPTPAEPGAGAGPAPGPDGPAEPGSTAARRRTHPITPLMTGWKIVVGVIAVLAAQNIAQLVDDFTGRRALIGLAVVAIVLAAVSWWFTTYAVDEAGVSLHRGMISRSREYAPRARIESVSVERPLLARVLGLAKVRVEVAGGGESYLDIEYVRSADAEELRRGIPGVAALDAPATAHDGPQDAEDDGAVPASARPAPGADGE